MVSWPSEIDTTGELHRPFFFILKKRLKKKKQFDSVFREENEVQWSVLGGWIAATEIWLKQLSLNSPTKHQLWCCL